MEESTFKQVCVRKPQDGHINSRVKVGGNRNEQKATWPIPDSYRNRDNAQSTEFLDDIIGSSRHSA